MKGCERESRRERPSLVKREGPSLPATLPRGLSYAAVLRSNTQQEQQPQTPSVAEFVRGIDDTLPGRLVEIATEATVQRVEELIRADRRITIGTVTTALGCSHGLGYSIMHDHLKF
jgi:hypothetical protein